MEQITTELGSHFAFTKEGEGRQRSLEREIATHNKAVEKYCNEYAGFRDEVVANWSANHETMGSKFRGRLSELLIQELDIRSRIASHWQQVGDVEIPACVDSAIARHAAKKAELIEKLSSIGFREDDHLSLETIADHHPDVAACWQQKESVHGKTPHLPPLNANAKAMATAQAELDAIKSRALSAL
jgi:hypothetical protein